MTAPSWAHTNWCRPSDPINIIFQNLSLQDIEAYLTTLKPKGWKHTRIASSQFIPFPNSLQKTRQSCQLSFGSVFKRYHIRMWEVKSHIVAGVHVDSLRFPGYHTSADFESAEKDFADICRQHWSVYDDAKDLNNQCSGYGQPYNNGKATVIEK